jgi:HTH-type transcriptional regulator, quorum sensing regulator NprR
MSNLGQKIKQLRLSKGMKQGELAKGLVTPSMISQIEAGKAQPSQKVLEEIANRLGTSVQYFLSDLRLKQEQSHMLRQARQWMERQHYERASDILEQLLQMNDFGADHSIALDLAECLVSMKDYEKAKELYLKLYEKGLQNFDSHIAVLALNKLGLIHHTQANYIVSNWYWEKALATAEKSGDVPLRLHAQVLINLGIITYRLGMYGKSESYYLAAYRMLRGSGHPQQIADASLGLGLVYSMLSNTDLAIRFTEEAHDYYQSLDMDEQALQSRINLAIFKRNNQQFEDSLAILLECIEAHAQESDWKDRPNVMSELARTYVKMASIKDSPQAKMENYDKAEQICKQAFLYCEHTSLQYADLCQILGDICRNRSQYTEATRYYKQSIRLFADHRLIPQLLQVCTSLANMQSDLGQHQVAVDTYIQMEKAIHQIVTQQLPYK